MHFQKDTENVKWWADRNGKSLQAELKAILEEQARLGNKAEACALTARIRDRIAARPQTDSGILQAEDRQYLACGRLDTRSRLA